MKEKLLSMNDRRKKEKRSPRGMRERERSSFKNPTFKFIQKKNPTFKYLTKLSDNYG